MLGMFSIGLKSLVFLAIATLCLVTVFISRLDEGNRIRQKVHIPQLPSIRSPDSTHSHPQAPLEQHPSDISPPPFSTGHDANAFVPDTPSSKLNQLKKERKERHPIDDLIDGAERQYDSILKKQTKGVKEAAAAYRKRRGRQPPPHFDEWVKFAESKNAIMVEDFFDQIYHDLDPFWALPPEAMRDAARAWKCFISIRDGQVTQHTDLKRPWMDLWSEMIEQIGGHLPDMDLAINEMDESRIMVAWESINSYLELAQMRYSKFPADPEAQITEYPNRFNNTADSELFPDHGFHTLGSLWSLVQEACPPESAGRAAQWDEVDYRLRAQFPKGLPDGSYNGFIANWTHSKDICVHAHLKELHGTFVEPISMSSTTKLIPMFGGSKLQTNNDILLPAAMYWTEDPFYKGSEKRIPWEDKENNLMWRGAASGGRNRGTNWRRFQRHRFVSMMNGTQVQAQELLNAAMEHPELRIDIGDADSKTPHNFPLPHQSLYNVSAQLDGRLGPWTDTFTDAKFAHLLCFPSEPGRGPNCSYTDPYFVTSPHTPMEDMYSHKYLPDIDGNSFSGRYRGFLRSFSLPLKATIYNEWHDSRLFAWKHFVPMDNTFVDFYAIMEYFLGYDPVSAGDPQLRKAHTLERPADTASTSATSDLETHDSLMRFDTGSAGAAGPRPAAAGSPLDAVPAPALAAAPEQQLPPPSQQQAASPPPPPTPPPPPAAPLQKRQFPPKPIKPQPAPKRHAHDFAARSIAEEGHDWAEKVLRKEDMLIYTYRLLLEYGRVTSDHRERMGWVGDDVVYGHNDEGDEKIVGQWTKNLGGVAGSLKPGGV